MLEKVISQDDISSLILLESGEYLVVDFAGVSFARRVKNPRWGEIEVIFPDSSPLKQIGVSKDGKIIFKAEGETKTYFETNDEYFTLDSQLSLKRL